MHRTLHIGRWAVDFLFEVDGYDIEKVMSYLVAADAPERVINQAIDLMEKGKENTGFTYVDEDEMYALVVIGPADSGKEFIDTLVHEIHHVAVAIASTLGVDLEGETPAYISGDSARALADLICRLGCSVEHYK